MRTARHRRARGSSAVLLWAVGTTPPRAQTDRRPGRSARIGAGGERQRGEHDFFHLQSYPILSCPILILILISARPLSPPQTPCRALRG